MLVFLVKTLLSQPLQKNRKVSANKLLPRNTLHLSRSSPTRQFRLPTDEYWGGYFKVQVSLKFIVCSEFLGGIVGRMS